MVNKRSGKASPVEGDLVVTPVAEHFAIGRLTATDDIQSLIEAQPDLTRALERACTLAGDDHRVFLAHNHRQTSDLIDCTDLAQYVATDARTPRLRRRKP